MDEFYITLPSNVKNDFYDNTIANFKTKLATNLKLDDKWCVGVASISYTNSWNVKAEIAVFNFSYWHIGNHQILDNSYNLDLSDYHTVEEVINEMNKRIKVYENSTELGDRKKLPRFLLNKLTNRVEIKPTFYKNSMIFPTMSENLCKVLGFDKRAMDNYKSEKQEQYRHDWESLTISQQFHAIVDYHTKKPNEADYSYVAEAPYNMLPTFSTIYLYCDLVKHNFVGDSFSQLMRIVEVPPKSKFRDQIYFNYTNIHYMPLQQTEFNTIEIHLKDDLGQTVPFLLVELSLHYILEDYKRSNK